MHRFPNHWIPTMTRRRPVTTFAGLPTILAVGLSLGLFPAGSADAAETGKIRLDLAQGILALSQDAVVEVADEDAANAEDPTATPSGMTDEEALAKKTQNPVADLISIPFQNNFTFGTGPGDGVLWVLNIQPVIPLELTEDWNVITRTIVPIIHQPGLTQGASSDNGVGDVQFAAFLSPSDAGELIWGAGPVFRLPTASRNSLGSEQWSAGPSVVALRSSGPWVFGGLVQQVWSFAGNSDRRDVSELLVQPFINYNMDDGWYLTASPVATANWKAARSSDRWTVPVGGGVGKIVRLGKLPVNMQLQAYYNVVRPDPIGAWTVRFQIQLLFPR